MIEYMEENDQSSTLSFENNTRQQEIYLKRQLNSFQLIST